MKSMRRFYESVVLRHLEKSFGGRGAVHEMPMNESVQSPAGCEARYQSWRRIGLDSEKRIYGRYCY